MPTTIALDVSLSMQRNIPGRQDLTYHQLALKGIHQFLDSVQKLEYISLITYSSNAEVVLTFTKDADAIRQALKKIEHCDKTMFEQLLRVASQSIFTNWGKRDQNHLLIFSDCGIGFGGGSIRSLISRFRNPKPSFDTEFVKHLKLVKIHIVGMGVLSDFYFSTAIQDYQELMDNIELKTVFYLPKSKEEPSEDHSSKSSGKSSSELGRTSMAEMIDRVYEQNFKPFEATLKCGGASRLLSKVIIYPAPEPYITTDEQSGNKITRNVSKNIEVCGFLSLSDIGSPATISRHVLSSKLRSDHHHKKGSKSPRRERQPSPTNESEKILQDIKNYYARGEDDSEEPLKISFENKDNACVLLHNALKTENLAALVILGDNWFGFLHSHTDAKKRSNMVLSVLPHGNNNIPWLGDFRMFGMQDDILPGENVGFPVKSDKRSYSQNSVVWIKHASLQSDIQKVLRHAKKLPEKTVHFYKELNRIRRAALSIGFCELLDTLAIVFEKEASSLPPNANPDCALQLKHAALNLKRGMDAKTVITALPTKYNQQ